MATDESDGLDLLKIENLPILKEFKEAAINPRGSGDKKHMGAVRMAALRFLFHPRRVGQIMRRLFERAQKNDTVLLRLADLYLPQKDTAPSVTINLNTPLLELSKSKKPVDITGEELEEAEVVKDA